MRRRGMNPILGIILAVFMIGAAVVLTIHDAGFIFLGKTLDLNSIIENGEELPRDSYVTYNCYLSFGNYAETTPYYGFIPLPGKSQEYAVLTEDRYVISAEINKRSLLYEMDSLTESFFSDEDTDHVPVTLTGCLTTISPDMGGYLEEYFDGFDLSENGIQLTYYAIDTTKTRLFLAVTYFAFAALGVAVGFVYLKKLVRGK